MKSIFQALLMLLIISAASADSGTLSKGDFTSAFAERLAAEIGADVFTVESDLNIKVNDTDGFQMFVFLDNAYDGYRSGLRTFDQVFADQLASIKSRQTILSSNEAKSILPVIKPVSYIDTVKRQLKEAGQADLALPMYVETLNNDMVVLYVFDTTDSMRFVSHEDMIDLGIAETDIRTLAKQNLDIYLEKVSATIAQIDTQGQGELFMLQVDDNYEASALMSNVLWSGDNVSVNGDVVAFVPARNVMLIVGSKDALGLQFAANIADDAHAEMSYSISPHGYRRVGDDWQRFK